MPKPEPPTLNTWLAWCANCHENRPVDAKPERDAKTGQAYFEYVCCECAWIVLTITHAETSLAPTTR